MNTTLSEISPVDFTLAAKVLNNSKFEIKVESLTWGTLPLTWGRWSGPRPWKGPRGWCPRFQTCRCRWTWSAAEGRRCQCPLFLCGVSDPPRNRFGTGTRWKRPIWDQYSKTLLLQSIDWRVNYCKILGCQWENLQPSTLVHLKTSWAILCKITIGANGINTFLQFNNMMQK